MRALRRDTLEWEEVTIKGKDATEYLTFSDGRKINFLNALAYEGEISGRGYGYCTYCRKIMTKKQYDKHIDVHACVKRCKDCSYLRFSNQKMTKSGDKYVVKSTAYCYYQSKEITPNMDCGYHRCNGSFSKAIPLLTVRVPHKILTLKAFEDESRWILQRVSNTDEYQKLMFKHYRFNLFAFIDVHGYLSYFEYKGDKCYFDRAKDALINRYGRVVSDSEPLLKVIRRLYE